MPFNQTDQLSTTNRVLLELEKQSLTSESLARILNGVTRPYATKLLKKMWKIGYAERKKIQVQSRGEAYFEYTITEYGSRKCNYLRQKGVV